MKSAHRPHRRPGRRGDVEPPKPRVNLAALIFACAVAAAGAFWLTQKLLAPNGPVLVSSNQVTLSAEAIAPVPLPPTNSVPEAPAPAAQKPMVINLDTPAPIDTNDTVQLINRGTALLEQGEVDQAIEVYRQALAINPEDEEAHFNLGFAHSKKGNLDQAIQHYEKALELFSDYGEAHNNLGNIYVKQKLYQKAVPHFEAAIKINPENSSAFNNLGRCLGEQGRTRDAIKQFQQAIQLNTNYVEARFNLGNSYLMMGQPKEAIQQFETLLSLAPDFQPARNGLLHATNALRLIQNGPPQPPLRP